MSKLEPQVGDKVTLTHEQGFVVKGRLVDRAFTGDWERWTIQNVGKFYDDAGWSVTAVEKPKREPGTFIKGVDVDGDQFVGVFDGRNSDLAIAGAYWKGDGSSGATNRWYWHEIASWEPIS